MSNFDNFFSRISLGGTSRKSSNGDSATESVAIQKEELETGTVTIKASQGSLNSSIASDNKGTIIENSNIVSYTKDMYNSLKRAPRCTTVSVFERQPRYQQGKLIAVNNTYICYAVKDGMIRILNKKTVIRALLKGGHSGDIADMAFPSDDNNTLASIGKEGTVKIWNIYEEMVNDQPKIKHALLVSIDNYSGSSKLSWHPENLSWLAVTHNNSSGGTVNVFDISKTSDNSTTEENTALVLPPFFSYTETSTEAPFTDLNFSPSGNFFAVAVKDVVKIWSNLDSSVKKELQIESNVHQIFFLDDQHIIVTSNNNSHLQLINFTQNIELQNFTFAPYNNGAERRMNINLDKRLDLLFITDVDNPELFILRVKKTSSGVCSFGYITPFELTKSIISCTSVYAPVEVAPQNGDDIPSHEYNLFCVQQKNIQLYHFYPVECQQQLETTVKVEEEEEEEDISQSLLIPKQVEPVPQEVPVAVVASDENTAPKQQLQEAPAVIPSPVVTQKVDITGLLKRSSQSPKSVEMGNNNNTSTSSLAPPTSSFPSSSPPKVQSTAPLSISAPKPKPVPIALQVQQILKKPVVEESPKVTVEKKESSINSNSLPPTSSSESPSPKMSMPMDEKNPVSLKKEFERLETNISRSLKQIVLDKKATDKEKNKLEKKLNDLESVVKTEISKVCTDITKAMQTNKGSSTDKDLKKFLTTFEQRLADIIGSTLSQIVPTISTNISNSVFPQIKVVIERLCVQIATFNNELAETLKANTSEITEMKGQIQTLTSIIIDMKNEMEMLRNTIARQQSNMSPQQSSEYLDTSNTNTKEANIRKEIETCIRNFDYEMGFKKALQSEESNILFWTFRQVKMSDIFDKEPSPLGNAVLLAILITISRTDLSTQVNLKLSWLTQICDILDVKDNEIAHLAKELLVQAKDALKASEANQSKPKDMRRILLMLDGLIAASFNN